MVGPPRVPVARRAIKSLRFQETFNLLHINYLKSTHRATLQVDLCYNALKLLKKLTVFIHCYIDTLVSTLQANVNTGNNDRRAADQKNEKAKAARPCYVGCSIIIILLYSYIRCTHTKQRSTLVSGMCV